MLIPALCALWYVPCRSENKTEEEEEKEEEEEEEEVVQESREEAVDVIEEIVEKEDTYRRTSRFKATSVADAWRHPKR